MNRRISLCLSPLAIAMVNGVAMPALAQSGGALPTVEVNAKQVQTYNGNRDVARSEDDAQAYVIITQETIENSGATNMEDLLSRVLSMNTSVENQTASGWTGNSSQLNLRGLGANHTLVLINGRRGAGVGSRGASEASDQVNINGLPLAAIERIEVLPASASAIYGSNALGGVVNVILRKDYVGTEVNVRYDNSFDTDSAIKTFDFTSGFALEDGRTQVLVSGQKKSVNALLVKDRDFAEQGRANILANNPDAIYGMNGRNAVQPPHGRLVNIRTVNGSPLLPNVSDASFAYLPEGYAGWQVDGVAPIEQTLGSYSLDLSEGIGSYSGVGNLVGESESESVMLSLSRAFTNNLDVFVEAGIDRSEIQSAGNYHGFGVVTLAKNAPNNPFGQAIYVAYPANYADGKAQQHRLSELETQRAALGASWKISPNWAATFDYAYSNARNDLSYQRRSTANTTAYNAALLSGELDVLRDVTSFTTNLDPYWSIAPNFSDQTLNDFSLRVNGVLGAWHAGDIRLATGIEHRDIESDARSETQVINNPDIVAAARSHETRAYYAELSVPLVSPDMQLAWLERAELQVAARREHFDVTSTPAYALGATAITSTADFGATSPTIGITLEPSKHWLLRASFSEGFITPSVSQLAEPQVGTSLTKIVDPLRGNEEVELYVTSGGNPSIAPEAAESRNLGVVWIPDYWISGLRVSVDYFDIRKENTITSLGAQALVDSEMYFSDRIVRSDELTGGYSVGAIEEIYTGPFNAMWLETKGVDTAITFVRETPWGELTTNVGYTYTDQYQRQDSFNGPAQTYLRIAGDEGVLEHRFNASAMLKINGNWSLGWAMQYYGSYRLTAEAEILAKGNDRVDDQEYHDLFVRAAVPTLHKSMAASQITFGIKNVFNESQMEGTDISRYTNPRMRQYYINAKFNF